MAQHYLLSSKSKNLNLKQIFRLSEDEAFQLLKANPVKEIMQKPQNNMSKLPQNKSLRITIQGV